MQRVLLAAAIAALALAVCGAETPTTPAKKKAPPKKSATVTKKPGTPSPSTASHTAAASRNHTASARTSKKPAPKTTWRNRQSAPAPERYKEIQEALVAKGYLKPEEATGSWGDSSTDALKRFQTDQKLDSTGKINALSLIGLGLGPKHDAAPVATKPPEQ